MSKTIQHVNKVELVPETVKLENVHHRFPLGSGYGMISVDPMNNDMLQVHKLIEIGCIRKYAVL